MNFKKKAAIFGLCLISMLVCTTMGYMWFTRQIPNTCTINAQWDIKLLRGDTMEVLTSIDWGNLNPGETRTTNQLYAGKCNYIRNDGNSLAYIAWQLDPSSVLPAGVSITAKYGDPPSTVWTQNQFSSVCVGAGETYGRVEFDLSTSLTSPPGAFSFTINLLAADSGMG